MLIPVHRTSWESAKIENDLDTERGATRQTTAFQHVKSYRTLNVHTSPSN